MINTPIIIVKFIQFLLIGDLLSIIIQKKAIANATIKKIFVPFKLLCTIFFPS